MHFTISSNTDLDRHPNNVTPIPRWVGWYLKEHEEKGHKGSVIYPLAFELEDLKMLVV